MAKIVRALVLMLAVLNVNAACDQGPEPVRPERLILSGTEYELMKVKEYEQLAVKTGVAKTTLAKMPKFGVEFNLSDDLSIFWDKEASDDQRSRYVFDFDWPATVYMDANFYQQRPQMVLNITRLPLELTGDRVDGNDFEIVDWSQVSFGADDSPIFWRVVMNGLVPITVYYTDTKDYRLTFAISGFPAMLKDNKLSQTVNLSFLRVISTLRFL